ncbi:MAG: hypothetical protein ACRCTZ_11725, partial [Sarcina sp.]
MSKNRKIASTAMAVTMIAATTANTVATAAPSSKNEKLTVKAVNQKNKAGQAESFAVDPGDLTVSFSPATTATVNGQTATTAESQSTINYHVNINFASKSGQNYQVNGVKLVANPVITYDTTGMTAAEKAQAAAEAAQITQEIQTQVQGINPNETSTSSFSGIVSVKLGYVDCHMKINPNITLEANGQQYPVSAPTVNLKNHYYVNVSPVVGTTQNSAGDMNGITIGQVGYNGVPVTADGKDDQGNVGNGVLNPGSHQIKSITFSLSGLPSSATVSINPAYQGEIVKNANGTYTATGDAVNLFTGQGLQQQGQPPAFNTSPIPKNISGQVKITPTNIVYDGWNNNDNVATIKYTQGQAVYNNQQPYEPPVGPIGVLKDGAVQKNNCENLGMTVPSPTGIGTTQTPYGNTGVDNYSSKLVNLKNNYDVYVGSFVQDGAIALYNNGSSNVNGNSNQTYVALTSAATQIMASGTPAQKQQLMAQIAAQDSSVGTFYSYSQIQQMAQNGQKVPGTINFVYQKENYQAGSTTEYNGSVNVVGISDCQNNPGVQPGIYQPTEGPLAGNIITKTITYAVQSGSGPNNDAAQMAKGLNKNYDVEGTTNGQYHFMMGNGNYDANDANQLNNGDNNNLAPATVRFGYNQNVNVSRYQNVMPTKEDFVGVETNGKLEGQNGNGVTPSDSNTWLTENHTFKFQIAQQGTLQPSVYKKGTSVTLDMGAPFQVHGNIVLKGATNVTLTPADYKVEGNKIVITLPQNVAGATVPFNIGNTTAQNQSTLGIEVPGSYDITSIKGTSLTIHPKISVPLYPYKAVNGNYYLSAHNSTSNQGSITIHSVAKNAALHLTSTVNSENEATITDEMHNSSLSPATYTIVAEIPQSGDTSTLPGKSGEPGTGGLGVALTSLNVGNTPTWVLPASQFNNPENNAIITDPDSSNLAGLTPEKLQSLGWVKYTPGMDLSNMKAYVVKPTVAANQNWSFNYNVKLSNVNQNVEQIATSQFKYYQDGTGLHSRSNIVVISPNPNATQNTWNSIVKVNGEEVPQSVLPAGLISLINSGVNPDEIGADGLLTPQVLQNEVDLYYQQTGKQIIAASNYTSPDGKLVIKKGEVLNFGWNGNTTSVKIGKGADTPVNEAWFENTGIIGDTSHVKVTFNLSTAKPVKPVETVKDTVRVQVQNSDGTVTPITVANASNYPGGKNIVPQATAQAGIPGSESGVVTPTIPNGYHITQITSTPEGTQKTEYNGIGTNTYKVPTTLGDKDNNIIYTIAHDKGSLNVTVVDENGKVLVPTKTVQDNVDTGVALANYQAPALPAGYELVPEKTTIQTPS